MILFQRYHAHRLGDILHSDFALFELAIWIHVLARSMTSIFIPIFLLNIGFALGDVMLFLFVYVLLDLPLNFFAKWLVYKIGARWVVLLGTLCYIVFYGSLLEVRPDAWGLLAIMALTLALYDTLYWVGHIYLFMICESRQRGTSQNVSFIYIAKRIAGMISPAVGAAVLAFAGRQVLIVISMVLLIVSTLPLFKMHRFLDKPKGKPVGFREFFSRGKRLKEYIMMSLYAFHGASDGLIWPIFIFILYRSIESVALIPIIASLAVIIVTYFSGKLKAASRQKTMALGALLVAMLWTMRLFFDNRIFLFGSVFLMAVFSVLVMLPLDSDLFEKGKRKDALATAAYRNLFSMVPRALFYGALFLLVEIFQASFLMAITAMISVMLIALLWVERQQEA